MRKLFASDFDGTLHFWDTDDRYLVSPENTEAIRGFQEDGGLFGVCTGRPLLGLTNQIDEAPGLDFSFDFYIATTGPRSGTATGSSSGTRPSTGSLPLSSTAPTAP